MNGVEESDEERFFECQVNVTLPSRTPVVGIEFTPNVFVSRNQGSSNVLQQNLLRFTWYRKEITSFLGKDRNTCFVHSDRLATVQCTSCLTLNLPLEQSYHCSANCFIQAWKSHMLSHSCALETARAKNEAVAVATELRSCGSWCENETPSMVEQWTEVGSLKSYAPTSNDFGCILRLVSVAVDCSTGGASTDTVRHGLLYGNIAAKNYSMRSSSMMLISFVFRSYRVIILKVSSNQSWQNVATPLCTRRKPRSSIQLTNT